MKDCPMCGCHRVGDPNFDTHFCVECHENLENVLGAGFEGNDYGPQDRADAMRFWTNRMIWVLGELFYRVSAAEDTIFRLETKILEMRSSNEDDDC